MTAPRPLGGPSRALGHRYRRRHAWQQSPLHAGRGTHPGIQQATGRRIQAGRDDLHGRDADAREANFLGLRIGSPILAGAHRLWDDEGVIEYGEWCLPYRLVVGYEYSFEAAPDAS